MSCYDYFQEELNRLAGSWVVRVAAEVDLPRELVGHNDYGSMLRFFDRSKPTYEVNGDHFLWVSSDDRMDIRPFCWLVCCSLIQVTSSHELFHFLLQPLPTKPLKKTDIGLLDSQMPSYGCLVILANELSS